MENKTSGNHVGPFMPTLITVKKVKELINIDTSCVMNNNIITNIYLMYIYTSRAINI